MDNYELLDSRRIPITRSEVQHWRPALLQLSHRIASLFTQIDVSWSRYSSMASRIFALASASVSPAEAQPGSSWHTAE